MNDKDFNAAMLDGQVELSLRIVDLLEKGEVRLNPHTSVALMGIAMVVADLPNKSKEFQSIFTAGLINAMLRGVDKEAVFAHLSKIWEQKDTTVKTREEIAEDLNVKGIALIELLREHPEMFRPDVLTASMLVNEGAKMLKFCKADPALIAHLIGLLIQTSGNTYQPVLMELNDVVSNLTDESAQDR